VTDLEVVLAAAVCIPGPLTTKTIVPITANTATTVITHQLDCFKKECFCIEVLFLPHKIGCPSWTVARRITEVLYWACQMTLQIKRLLALCVSLIVVLLASRFLANYL
jgi:hypothetical protein